MQTSVISLLLYIAVTNVEVLQKVLTRNYIKCKKPEFRLKLISKNIKYQLKIR